MGRIVPEEALLTDTETIVSWFNERKMAMGPTLNRMRQLADAVNGDVIIPLPELDASERPAVANLIAQGLDQTAQRIASTLPNVNCPPVRPGFQVSEDKARKRRAAILGWWDMNKLNLIQRRRARWLIGYGCAPVVLRPHMKRRIPMWHARNPLTTYPPPDADMDPQDCIFTFQRPLSWLRKEYPDAILRLAKGRNPRPDDRFELLEFVDGEEHVLIAMGRSSPYAWEPMDPEGGGGAPFVQLERLENKAGICPVVIPGRLSLDRQQGQFDSLVGLYWTQAKLMALETIAVERAIFPDEWLISRPGESAEIVNMADGLRGEVGKVSGGDLIPRPINPGVQTYPTIDRLERAMRLAGGIPAEFGGESTSNVRTGRRGQAVLSAAVDFPIQEAQELMASALQEENVRAIAIDRAHFGDMAKSFYFSWNGRQGRADYTPNEVFETDHNLVNYSFPGADINQLVIGTGQRIGMGTMSKRRGMELDPMIDDPEAEHDLIIAEGLEMAMVQSLQQMAASGGLAPADLSRITQLTVAQNIPLYEAVQQAQEEAQARQAPAGGAGPVDPNSPEAQMGLTESPTAPAGVEPIAEGGRSMANLSQLLSNLRRPAMATPGG